MSVQALAWVLDESEATGGDRLVLIALANHYSRDGLCCPGYDTIAREARLSRSAVIRAVARLEAGGHVEVARDATPGRSRVNHYVILGFEEGSRNATLSGDKGSRGDRERVAFGTEKGSRGRDPNQERTVTTEPCAQPLTLIAEEPERAPVYEEFAEWYAAYPRKRARDDALSAYKAVRSRKPRAGELPVATHAELLAAARNLAAAGGDVNFTPYPATWLRSGDWRDWVEGDPERRMARAPKESPFDAIARGDRERARG